MIINSEKASDKTQYPFLFKNEVGIEGNFFNLINSIYEKNHNIIFHNEILDTFPLSSVAKQESVQFSSVAQSCLTFCDPMNRSTPGLPVHHQLSEFTQTHAHWVSDAIQPSHPLSSPSPPAPNPSQHQGLFQRVNSLEETLMLGGIGGRNIYSQFCSTLFQRLFSVQ